MLKVTMLQTPRIELDGEDVSLPFKRADALLYYMLVQRSATRQELIALLWEGCDEATGLKNLRNALYTLKKALGGDVLISPQKSLVAVNEDWEIESDYDRFVRRGDFSAYEGQFLQGFSVKRAFSYDEWMNRTREKLREQYLHELNQRARAAHAAGDERGALRWGQTYLREEPYDEGMASFLMERYRESKKFPAAAKVYQKLKDCLLQELGVAPQESTTLLYYEIMNQWNDNSAEADESWLPAGRESDFAALRAALSSFAAGAALRSSQLLRGETGSGKSELIGTTLCARLGVRGDEGDYGHDGDIGGGQYLNACVWFEILTGESCLGNTFRPSYELSEEKIAILQAAAHQAVADRKAE